MTRKLTALLIAALALSACRDDETDEDMMTERPPRIRAEANNSTNNTTPEVNPDDPDPSELATRAWVVGRSEQGRPLLAEVCGTEGPVMLLISAIHGDERTAATFGERVRSELLGGMAQRTGVRVVFMQVTNPDGLALNTRENVNDVDLNRNFDARNFDPNGTGGRAPLSESETRAMANVIDTLRPQAVVSVHCCIPTMDYDGPGKGLAEAMAEPTRFPAERLGSSRGSMGSYVGVDLNIPIITLEFARQSRQNVKTQLTEVMEGIEAGMTWMAANQSAPSIDVDDVIAGLAIDGVDAYDSYDLTRTKNDLPVRVDEIGRGEDPPLLILAGLDDNGRNSRYLAEHVRRVLFAEAENLDRVIVVTGVNPDGIEDSSVRGPDDVSIRDDFARERYATREARAVRDLIEAREPWLIVHIGRDATQDRVQYTRRVNSSELGRFLPSELGRGPIDDATHPVEATLDGLGYPVVRLGVWTAFARGDNRFSQVFEFDEPEPFSDTVLRILMAERESLVR